MDAASHPRSKGSSRNGLVKRLSMTKQQNSMETLNSENKDETTRISVQAVVTLMCFTGIVVSSLSSTMLLSQESQKTAVDMTRDSGDRATNSCFTTAEDSVNTIIQDLLGSSADGVTGLVLNFFFAFVYEIDRLSLIMQTYHGSQDTTSFPWMESVGHHFLVSQRSMIRQGAVSVGIGSKSDKLVMYSHGVSGFVYLENNGSYQNTLAYLVNTDGDVLFPLPYDVGTPGVLPGNVYGSKGLLKPNETKFSAVNPYRAYIGVMLTNLRLDANGAQIYLYIAISLENISKFLKKLVNDSPNRDHMRMYTCTGPSWVRKGYLDLGEVPGSETEERLLTGVSNGDAWKTNGAEDVQPLKDVNATDGIIASIARGIDEYSEIFNSSKVITVNGQFVVVKRILDEVHSIDWWCVISLNSTVMLSEINAKSAQIQSNIAHDRHEVQEEIDKKLVATIVIVGSIGIALCVASALVTGFILRPINLLVSDMNHVSAMDLDKEAGLNSLSGLKEVRKMQLSFRKMKRNLKDFRAFVPSSLLNSNNDVTHIEPPTGIVTVVFTDICKSTQLWEQSVPGMNIAMEMHNTVIRESIAEHDGYEVKTIGDAFMVTFDSPHNAVLFSLKTQTSLAAQTWPAELDLLYGLQVRIGAHTGHTIPEENPLTGRRDYRGLTVNVASRCEAIASPGTICITQDLYQAIHNEDIGSPKIQDIGMQSLKGIEEPQKLYLMADKAVMHHEMHEVFNDSKTRSSTGSTGGIVPVKVAVGQTNGKKTGLTLVKGQASVGVCRMAGNQKESDIFDVCNGMVHAAIDAASRTDGIVGEVTGSTIIVIWNASKPCRLHTTSAMRFAAELVNRTSTIMTVGLATGPILFGNVGTHKRRFNSIFGRPVEAASTAAVLAATYDAFCLLVDCTTDSSVTRSSAVSPFVRLADVWLDTDAAHYLTFYDLLSSKLREQLEEAWGMPGYESSSETESHNEAFRAAVSGDHEGVARLRLMSALRSEDRTLQKIISQLGKIPKTISPDRSRLHRVSVTFTHLPEGVFQ
eukprot:TRINITY_DN8605_c0_g2_i1.p1 TRINITY_DN8605_c0_g2~~TRINITY_DN8605_c0_g2_i1.p1  ORF type:complete len:1046 (+),score=117.40 TRINITY_DN8605_c0_g2_i1:46-3138(+)